MSENAANTSSEGGGDAAAKKPSGCGAGCLTVLGAFVLIAVVVFLFSSCRTGSGSSSTSSETETSKYTQTWSKDYASTTCDDWNEEMTSGQQFAAAADILTAARNKIDGGTGLPPDSLITEFQGGVTTVCVVPSMTLTDATYGLYTTEPRFHP